MAWLALVLALAAQGSKEEKGKFRLTYFGREAGSEEYRIEVFEDGHVAVFSKAKFEVEIQGQKRPYHVDTALTLDKDWAPHLYAGYRKIGTEESLAKIEWKKGAAVVDRKKEVKTSAAFVADNNVFAHLLPLLRRYGGGRRKVKVFNPTALADLEAGIEDLGEATLHGPGRAVQAREYRIAMGTLGTVTAHVDAEKRILRAWNPMIAGLAELEGFEGLSREPPGGTRPEEVVEAEVEFPGGAARLKGAITRPRKEGPCPGVVLLSDEGPHDRDGNFRAEGGVPGDDRERSWSGLRHVAHALSGAGAIVLRYDDRGCGGSGGEHGTARLSDLAAAARAAVDFLRKRPDAAGVGIAGHGEGGAIAAMVAAADPEVRAVFLLAAPARPWDAVLLERLERRLREQGTREDLVPGLLAKERRLFDGIRKAEGDYLEIDERRTFIGRLREHFALDPAAEVRKAKGAVVVLQGMRDRAVGPDHAERLREARPDAEVRRFEALDHLFMPSEGRPGDLAETARRPDAEFLKVLAERVAARMK